MSEKTVTLTVREYDEAMRGAHEQGFALGQRVGLTPQQRNALDYGEMTRTERAAQEEGEDV